MILIEWLKAYFEFPLWKELGPIFGPWIEISLLLCVGLSLYAIIKKICELAKRLIVWLFTGKDPDKGFWSVSEDGKEYWIEWDRMEKGLPPIESRPIKKKRLIAWFTTGEKPNGKHQTNDMMEIWYFGRVYAYCSKCDEYISISETCKGTTDSSDGKPRPVLRCGRCGAIWKYLD